MSTAPTLSDSLATSRLTHREARLRLVLAVLGERVRDLEQRGDRVPEGLRAAIRGFHEDLAGVRRQVASLRARQPAAIRDTL
jgi:hypothetical protein